MTGVKRPSSGKNAGARDSEELGTGVESRELPSDRDRDHPAGRASGLDVRERKGGGEAPWCERCVGMTVFTKEMKERG